MVSGEKTVQSAVRARYLLGVDSSLFQFSHSSRLLFLGWVCVLGLPSCRLSYLTPLFHAESVSILCLLAAALSACRIVLDTPFRLSLLLCLWSPTHKLVIFQLGAHSQPPWTSHPCFMACTHASSSTLYIPAVGLRDHPCSSPMWPFFHDYKLVFHLMAFASTVPLLGKRSRFFL